MKCKKMYAGIAAMLIAITAAAGGIIYRAAADGGGMGLPEMPDGAKEESGSRFSAEGTTQLQTGAEEKQAALVTFANPEDVTISVSVSEEDVTDIAVGDVVNIALTAYEDIIYEGTVLQIDTSASGGSSTVSYTVTAAFTGDVTGIYADMTGNVTFVKEEAGDVLYVSVKLGCWDFPNVSAISQMNFPAGSSSVLRSRVLSQADRQYCWRTSRQVRWTETAAGRCQGLWMESCLRLNVRSAPCIPAASCRLPA